MNNLLKSRIAASLITVALASNAVAADTVIASFDWQNVRLGGGGYVTGLIVDPVSPDRIYARTDVGGLYARDRGAAEWRPLTDAFGRAERGDLSIESAAIDPADPKTLYVAVGMYTADWWPLPGGVRKSIDGGRTWSPAARLLRSDGKPVKFGGNETKRWAGERLAVDPFDRKHLLIGTRRDGLFESTDGGASFHPVATPTRPLGIGITSVLFDRKIKGRVVFAAYGDGVYRSADAGRTWSRDSDGPTLVNRLTQAPDGTLWAACASKPTPGQGVFKYSDGAWTNVTPASPWPPHYVAVAVDPTDSRHALAATGEADLLKLFATRDGGATWKEVTRTAKSTVPWTFDYLLRIPWTADLKFDPTDPKRIYVTDWFGAWTTADINAPTVELTNLIAGLEAMVIFDIVALPDGALLTGCADLGGFAHRDGDLKKWPTKLASPPKQDWQDTYSVDYCRSKPTRVVRVGARRDGDAGFWLGVSDDGGVTWRAPAAVGRPAGRLSRVAVSSTDPQTFVIVADGVPAIVTRDGGETFTNIPAGQLPAAPFGAWYTGHPLAADLMNGQRFYYLHPDGRFFVSNDGGATWTAADKKGGPGKAVSDAGGAPPVVRPSAITRDRVYVAHDASGLFRSDNAGRTFTRVAAVEHPGALAVGPTAGGGEVVYVWGTVGRQAGVFRSIDDGKTWQPITTDANPIALTQTLSADPVRPDRVFVGTNGRGVFVGQPAAAKP